MSRQKIEWNVELLHKSETDSMSKMMVYGGWILHHITFTKKGEICESMVFVPDRDHLWSIAQPFVEETMTRANIAKDFEPKA